MMLEEPHQVRPSFWSERVKLKVRHSAVHTFIVPAAQRIAGILGDLCDCI